MEACRRNRLQEGERLMREGLVLAKRGHHCDGGGGEWQQMEKLRALAMWPQSFKSTNREREREREQIKYNKNKYPTCYNKLYM